MKHRLLMALATFAVVSTIASAQETQSTVVVRKRHGCFAVADRNRIPV
jgi:hypothetical protein